MEPVPIERSWGGAADAVGHCLLIFAFVPVVAAIPGWLLAEAHNPLNATDLVVLAFLPVRGAVALLDGFAEGVVPGSLAGTLMGILLCAWTFAGRRPATAERPWLVGAVCGALAAAVLVAFVAARMVGAGHELALPLLPVAFEIGSGTCCGALAAPTAVRLLAGNAARRGEPSHA